MFSSFQKSNEFDQIQAKSQTPLNYCQTNNAIFTGSPGFPAPPYLTPYVSSLRVSLPNIYHCSIHISSSTIYIFIPSFFSHIWWSPSCPWIKFYFSLRIQNFQCQMRNERGGVVLAERNVLPRPKLSAILRSDPKNDEEEMNRRSNVSMDSSVPPSSGENSPLVMSPWNHPSSPFAKSPWTKSSSPMGLPQNGLIGSMVREEGHVYSLAATGNLLYTGSDSKNIRVWKNLKAYSGFKSNSGLVKAIVISGEKIFTGHQDGKIRVWRVSPKNPKLHKRIGSLPTFKDFLKSSINPKNYVKVRRKRSVLRIKHFDAVSCLSLDQDQGLLYSGSWDKTLKVWRISDSKCLESIRAHDDAINAVVAGFAGLVFTGSADGTVKVWHRQLHGKGTKHLFLQTLLNQETAITSLAVNTEGAIIYCGSSDGLVNFWEREKHLKHGGVLRGHKHAVLCLATAGNLVFSGSADKSICVWRREGGVHTCLSVLTGHTGPVKCLAVEEDQESTQGDQRWIVYSGSLDKSVKIWRVSEQAPDIQQMRLMAQNYVPSPLSSPAKWATTPTPNSIQVIGI